MKVYIDLIEKIVYKLITDFPVAVDSPDHVYPQGTKNILGGSYYEWSDGHNPFVDEVVDYFKKPTLRVLDLGAASGYLVSDFLSRGCQTVGLEGSDWPIINNVSNWKKLQNKNLFTCDISKPFQLFESDKEAKFDLINAWEVIEHIAPKDLATFADNVYKHLADDGIFVFSISPWFEPSKINRKINLHLSYEINKKAQWREIFNKFEFVGPLSEEYDSGYHYIFNHRYRGKVREAEGMQHTFWSTLKKKII
jgi:SAM-dependent methyltransferase